ncbi:uracil-DNA glycosylase family protein [Ulvibacter litoralis]|uniref:G:T/U-mismatch repair DNA glycosylase n=1 Tax=Ulvibacter litoralis TaxID=227084 RepID=A0A1G7IZR1_9FLAO|nr:uracil-DNA glycosylase family protein [Ulvibacter litoralis]GHC60349.1 DNA glycosylase [Ulvibacter litoralis]SDF18187.1 G:T/U-mismatch repair DNA glycosylase [Ulvibacter litoralis]
MFHHTHPYPPFIPENTTKLIVGTLPPPRFTSGDLKEGDVNFCYGSRDGQLWPILDRIFELDLKFETTAEAIEQRKNFLKARNIGICDIVASAKRDKIDASDLGMQDIELRDVVAVLQKYPKVDTLLFTGGNSKNGPEYFFRRHLKTYSVSLEVIDDTVPRIHAFTLPESFRKIKTVSLTAPSGAANRAVGSLLAYREMKATFPEKTTIDFRIEQYTPFF